MPYSELLADRIRQVLKQKRVAYEEKKMMGGLTFMVDKKMCVGIVKDDLMARVGKDNYENALKKKGCRKMDFTGKPLKGFVFVDAEGIDLDDDLEAWIDQALEFVRGL